jgi:two-component system phosphate regulon response regulator OmpR
LCPIANKHDRAKHGSGTGVTGPAKIALVEDEAFQRQVIAECLAQHGLRLTTLVSGAELKRLAQHAMPDPALLDGYLNEPEDGFALARWLRSRSARIGILMLKLDTKNREPIVRERESRKFNGAWHHAGVVRGGAAVTLVARSVAASRSATDAPAAAGRRQRP